MFHAASLVALCMGAVHVAIAANPLGPGAGPWTVESPEQHGMSAAGLKKGRDYLFAKSPVRNCMLVVKDGAIVYESYRPFANKNTITEAWSMTKTLGALLMGRGVTTGHLDIDADITKEYGVLSPKLYPTTSREIMAQAIAGNRGPGQKFSYDAVGIEWVNHLPFVLKSATGRQPSEIWRSDFYGPLGLSPHFSWPFPTNADLEWAFGSRGTCRDFARIGQLMLNKGKWPSSQGNETIISEDYIHQMTTPQTFSNGCANNCYGLLTWLETSPDTTKYPGRCYIPSGAIPREDLFPASFPHEYYFLGGAFGQIVLNVPSENMVVVTMGTAIAPGDIGGSRVAADLGIAVWCKAMGNKC